VEIRGSNWTGYKMKAKYKRPRQRWNDRVVKDLKELGIEIETSGGKWLLRQWA